MMRALLTLALLSSLAHAQDWGAWYALGPFDHEAGANDIAAVYAPERELGRMREGAAGPDLEQEHRLKARTRGLWRELGATRGQLDSGAVDFTRLFSAPEGVAGYHENAVAYLYRRIESSHEREIRVAIGSDDGLRLWFNGALLIDRNVARGVNLSDHQLVLRVPVGVSHLLVKVSQGGGSWGFHMAPWQRIPQSAIDQAIDRGVDWLLERQLVDGTWHDHVEYDAGSTAFATYCLLKCGVRKNHPAVSLGLRQAELDALATTYTASCALLAMEASGDPRYHERMEDIVEDLCDWQESNGLVGYPSHPTHGRIPEDLSNTLFAALAFRAAGRVGVEVRSRVWHELVRGTLDCLEKEREGRSPVTGERARAAGFSYRVHGAATGSMTTAGLSVIELAREALGGELPGTLRSRSAGARNAGLAWLDQHMDWTKNPPNSGHHYFWIYGLERVGVLLDLDILGGIDWYWSGADWLVKAQRGDGSWNGSHIDTILALLFLKRATASVTGNVQPRADAWVVEPNAEFELGLRANGESPTAVWISGLRPDVTEGFGEQLQVDSGRFVARYLEGGEQAEIELGAVRPMQVQHLDLHRVAVQHAFDRRGRWRVHAELVVRNESEQRTLRSAPLEFALVGQADAEQLEYAAQAASNLVTERGASAQASSQHGDQGAEKAIDGRQGTRWHCAKDDAQPSLNVRLERAVRADQVLLSHAWPRRSHYGAPQPARVLVVINGDDEFELAMDPDPMRKSVLELPQRMRVRTVELRILESRGRIVGRDSVGFGEVELVLSER